MPWSLCLVSCSELCAEEAGPGLGLWSLSWLPACVEINLSSLHSNGSVACRDFMEGNRVRADGRSGFPGISLQARGGRGSSLEAKCCCCPALPACVGVEMELWDTAVASGPGICFPKHGPRGSRPARQRPQQLSRAGTCAGRASVQSSACPPRTSCEAVLGAPSWTLGAARHRS